MPCLETTRRTAAEENVSPSLQVSTTPGRVVESRHRGPEIGRGPRGPSSPRQGETTRTPLTTPLLRRSFVGVRSAVDDRGGVSATGGSVSRGTRRTGGRTGLRLPTRVHTGVDTPGSCGGPTSRPPVRDHCWFLPLTPSHKDTTPTRADPPPRKDPPVRTPPARTTPVGKVWSDGNPVAPNPYGSSLVRPYTGSRSLRSDRAPCVQVL